MAIDLHKLEKKFIDLFENTTQEEFEQWLLTKKDTHSKPMTKQIHTTQFKNWVEEMLTEDYGREISAQGITYLQILYEDCTGKSPFKQKEHGTDKNKRNNI
jgi:hypothetical protein